MIPKFREWDAEREDIMPGKGMSYGCDEPIDININIKLTKKSLEDLNYKDLNHTVKAKLDRNGGLL